MSAPFDTLQTFRATLAAAPDADATARAGAQERNGQLTKPPGALGRLEDLAIWYAGWRGTAQPALNAPQVLVFAGNHGVCAQGVSAFPPEVTVQMVANFEHGGAAINQLSKAFGATMNVHALDLETPTADFTQSPAMSEARVLMMQALRAKPMSWPVALPRMTCATRLRPCAVWGAARLRPWPGQLPRPARTGSR